jgi:putative ABC transport system permease protein
MVRKKIDRPPGGPRAGVPEEYKETPSEDPENNFDPNSFLLTIPQMELAIRDLDGVNGITPRYAINGEYITLDGQKKYRLELGVLSEGLTQKTEAGHTINGTGQIVIPLGLARELSPQIADLVGKTATVAYKSVDGAIKTMPLEIAGVATKGFMTNYNSFVDTITARTIHTDQRTGEGLDKFPGFTIQMATNDTANIDAVKKSLGEKGFEADTIADTQKRTYDAIGIFKIGMSLFAFIALLAASFGIINTLVIAVLERTKEIGLQKALGMGRGKIFAVFSLESVLIGFWGALLGTLGGVVVGVIANKVLITAYADSFEGFTLFVFTFPSMAFVMAIVCAIAFFAGVLPAIRASRLNPIESLRYE